MADRNEYQEWSVLVYAESLIEATMVQTYLAGFDIESRQPFERHLLYDAGIGPGVAGELGIRVEVHAEKLEEASRLLKEHKEAMACGEVELDVEPGELTDPEEIERKIHLDAVTDGATGDARSSGLRIHAVTALFGIAVTTVGVALHLDARDVADENDMNAGAFIAAVGVVLTVYALVQGITPLRALRGQSRDESPILPAPVGRESSFGFYFLLFFLFGNAVVMPVIVIANVDYPSNIIAILLLVPAVVMWSTVIRLLSGGEVPPVRRGKVLLRLFAFGFMSLSGVVPLMLIFGKHGLFGQILGGAVTVLIIWSWRALIQAQMDEIQIARQWRKNALDKQHRYKA